jgi:transposase-like protein
MFKIIFIKILGGAIRLPQTKRRSPPMKNKIICPKCGYDKIVKFGKYPKTGEQKYRCKRCLCQFINGHTWKEKPRYPLTKYGLCPKCGARLEQRKMNKNTIQLRCSNRPFCKYTISYHFKLKTFFNLALSSENFFSLPKFFKFPIKTVLKAVKFSLILNLPARKIKEELGGKPSHVTIIKWTCKFAYLFSLFYNNHHSLSISADVWHIDDTIVKIKGVKYRLFIVFEPTSRLVLSWFLSPTKDKNACMMTLKLALKFTGKIPNLIISDNAEYISSAIKELFDSNVKHLRIGLFTKGEFSNNLLERFFSNIKSKFKNRKCLRSFKNALAIIGGIIVIYNFTKHSAISTSPALKAGIKWQNSYLFKILN